jgi:acylpyruvate hydrolase
MRLATLRINGATSAARVEGDKLIPLRAPDVAAVLQQSDRDRALNDDRGLAIPVNEAQFETLIPRPSKVFCVGLNYRQHIHEGARKRPSYPTLFAKFADTLIGAYDDLLLPRVSECTDWEAELGVVIGTFARHVTPREARQVIAGFTIINDVSVRDYQRRTEQSLQGKVFQSTTPVGPYVVSLDEFDNPLNLQVRCEVDGQLMQCGNTADLIFDPMHIVSYCSDIVALRPGDLIATGTPAGVGEVHDPPLFLSPGQILKTSIEDIGCCINRCVAEPF